MEERVLEPIRALVQGLARQGVGVSDVARLDHELDAIVERCAAREYAGPYPCVFLDVTVVEVHAAGMAQAMAVVLAVNVCADGGHEVLGLDVGPSEDRAYWLGFLRRLAARGLGETRLVASDHNWPLAAVLGAG